MSRVPWCGAPSNSRLRWRWQWRTRWGVGVAVAVAVGDGVADGVAVVVEDVVGAGDGVGVSVVVVAFWQYSNVQYTSRPSSKKLSWHPHDMEAGHVERTLQPRVGQVVPLNCSRAAK